MNLTQLLLPAFAAIVVFILYMVALQFAHKKESVGQRVQRMLGDQPRVEFEQDGNSVSDPLRADMERSPLAVTLEGLLKVIGVNVEAFREKAQVRFYRAGVNSIDAPTYFLAFRYFVGPLCLLLAGWEVFMLPGALLHYVMALLLIVIGFFGPGIYLDNARQKREKILQNSFPDALDLLLVCVDSGLALDGALARVCKELWKARPMIAQELNRTRVELTLLNDRARALSNLAERTNMLPFRSLVATLLQSERFGTSLTETLRVLSDDYRNMRLLLAEEKAGRLPVLITIPLVGLLMPALFIMILAPGIMTAIKSLHSI
jgi:tight adherence protein C